MNKILKGVAVFNLGLLFLCPKVEACESVTEIGELAWDYTEDIMQKVEENRNIEPTYYISDYDATLLLEVGVMEAGETDAEGIANVMQVVLNRVESDQFPDTVEEVIFQKHPTQFCTAKRLAKANITPEAYAALDQVIFGEFQSNEALFFESCKGKIWAKCYDYLFSYGGHDFYKLREG